MALVFYPSPEQPKDSWIRYSSYRVMRLNQGNLYAIVGPTGGGKTWAGLSICEQLSKKNKTEFNVHHVVFDLRELMALINSGKLKRGSCIVFDEPQVSISNREFQSKANKVFNYLLSTFRHRNYTLIFCTPYEDLLDKSTRKLFHAKFLMQSIDIKKKTSKVRPFSISYNSKFGKFYEKFLRVRYKPTNKSIYVTTPLKNWSIPKPSDELIKSYEKKKRAFTTTLNIEIEQELNKFKNKETGKEEKKPPTDKQARALLLKFELKDTKKVAEAIGVAYRTVDQYLAASRRKGWTPENYFLHYSSNNLPNPSKKSSLEYTKVAIPAHQ